MLIVILLFAQMIDEFTDVNAGEKELMKLWNSYSMENKSAALTIALALALANNSQRVLEKCSTTLVRQSPCKNA